ncbi:MAG TPA: urease accessory protein UreF [Methylomirabilota bacterium]
MTDQRLLSLLHFADSAFPTGGYAHSFGLEHYCQTGLVRDRDGLERFLVMQLEGSGGPCDATVVAGALRAAARDDLQACRELDRALEAMKVVKEFREGSRQMGRQTLRVAVALTGHPSLAVYLDEVNGDRTSGHHAVAFGMVAGTLGWDAQAAAIAFLYSTTALLVGAALRLLPMGQVEGQGVLWSLHPVIERVAREAAQRAPGDLSSFTPGLDIQGMLHERLDARLFRS